LNGQRINTEGRLGGKTFGTERRSSERGGGKKSRNERKTAYGLRQTFQEKRGKKRGDPNSEMTPYLGQYGKGGRYESKSRITPQS